MTWIPPAKWADERKQWAATRSGTPKLPYRITFNAGLAWLGAELRAERAFDEGYNNGYDDGSLFGWADDNDETYA